MPIVSKFWMSASRAPGGFKLGRFKLGRFKLGDSSWADPSWADLKRANPNREQYAMDQALRRIPDNALTGAWCLIHIEQRARQRRGIRILGIANAQCPRIALRIGQFTGIAVHRN